VVEGKQQRRVDVAGIAKEKGAPWSSISFLVVWLAVGCGEDAVLISGLGF
jgi:hypothetical protein